jgi:hypothetical protein
MKLEHALAIGLGRLERIGRIEKIEERLGVRNLIDVLEPL